MDSQDELYDKLKDIEPNPEPDKPQKEPQNQAELTPEDANIIKDVLIYNAQDFQKNKTETVKHNNNNGK